MAPTGEVKDTKEESRKRHKKKPSLIKAQYIFVWNGGLLFITDKSVAAAISMMEWLFALLPFYNMTMTIHRGGQYGLRLMLWPRVDVKVGMTRKKEGAKAEP